MPDGRALEERIITLQAEVRRLWQTLRRVEPALRALRYDRDGQPTHCLCRLCGAESPLDGEVRHKQECPFADLAFPIGAQSEKELH